MEKITPFWLGIGVSVGKKKFEPDSKDHLIMTSNGWISSFGKLVKTDVKYCLKDVVKVKYDKRMQLIEFMANSQNMPFLLKRNGINKFSYVVSFFIKMTVCKFWHDFSFSIFFNPIKL